MSTPTGEELSREEFGSLEEGDWFCSNTGSKTDDIFRKCCNEGKVIFRKRILK